LNRQTENIEAQDARVSPGRIEIPPEEEGERGTSIIAEK
jgi:hypothetical protein